MTDPNHIAEPRKKVSRPQIREVFLRNGFKIAPGRDDLPDYVYESAFELLEMAAPAVQGEPVGWQFYQDGKWWHGDDRIKDHRKNTEEAGFRVRDVYASPQPAPDVSGLVDALVACGRASSAAEVGLIVDEALAAFREGAQP